KAHCQAVVVYSSNAREATLAEAWSAKLRTKDWLARKAELGVTVTSKNTDVLAYLVVDPGVKRVVIKWPETGCHEVVARPCYRIGQRKKCQNLTRLWRDASVGDQTIRERAAIATLALFWRARSWVIDRTVLAQVTDSRRSSAGIF